MSIRLRSLGAVSRHFINHLNHAISMTVTRKPLTLAIEGNEANIRFRNGSEGSSAKIQTRFGPMELYLGQVCVSEAGVDGNHSLRTMQYRYMLTPDGHSEPRIRWEYVGYPIEDDLYCRHHVQGPIPLNLDDEANKPLTLNDLHLPTGWVPVEEVLRFCIVDLGVKPLSPDWNRILRESERLSRAEFAIMGEL